MLTAATLILAAALLVGGCMGVAIGLWSEARRERRSIAVAQSRPALGPYRAAWEAYGPRACEEYAPSSWLLQLRAMAESMRQAGLTTAQVEQALTAMVIAATVNGRGKVAEAIRRAKK